VNKLVKYCKTNSIKPDYIFCLGDIVTISQGSQGIKPICEVKEKEIKNLFSLLELICPNLIYLPGNHDPETLFKVEESPKITENSVNLHLKSEIIKDDLLLVGIGGSTCGISSKEEFYHSYHDLDTKAIIWKGYPYVDNNDSPNYEKSDEMFKKDLDKIDPMVDKHKGNVLVLSHVGPFTSNTANAYEDGLVYSGSPSLNEFLLKYENKIIGCVHGHTHFGPGMGQVHKIKICNPGAILFNSFGTLHLVKNAESNYNWKIDKYEQINLVE
jgi:Icc-related predicted phosphoesterase